MLSDSNESTTGPASTQEPQIPDTLGDYELIRRLGEGGMGYVYLARQKSKNRKVALKLLPTRPGLQQRDVERFMREASSAAKLDHPSIVRIHDVASIDGIHLYAMDFIQGHDLGREIHLLKQERDRQPLDEPHLLPRWKSQEYFPTIVKIVAEVGDALEHAHLEGIVHRDIKPQNVLIESDLRVFIVDFGLARDDALSGITMSGDLVGSPAYMSPEQVIGRRGKIDRRTDVYSLGVLLYELLTLKRPFEGRTSREILNFVLEKEPIPLRRHNPRVPVDLETICLKAMSRDPDDRYESAEAFAADCRRFLAHESIDAIPPTLRHRISTFLFHRHRVETFVTAAAIVSLSIVGYFALRSMGRSHLEQQVEELRDIVGNDAVFARRDEERIQRLVALLRDLVHQRAELLPEQVEVIERARSRMQGVVDDLAQEGLSIVERAASERDPSIVAERTTLALELLDRASRYSRTESVDVAPRVPALIQPVVTAEAVDNFGSPKKATLYSRRADAVTGELGPTFEISPVPCTHRFDPGFYRLTIVFDEGGYREFARRLDPLESTTLRAVARRDETSIKKGMIEFGRSETKCIDHWYCALNGKSVTIEPFLLDATEVTNGEYKAFCDATGTPRPYYFAKAVDFDDIKDLPVCFVPYDHMVAYAEWCGKRLPTHSELALATIGPLGHERKWAWGDVDPTLIGANLATSPEGFLRGGAPITQFEQALRPVRSGEGAKSPDGVYHLSGNVREATETPGTAFTFAESRSPTSRGAPSGVDLRTVLVFGDSFDTPLHDENRCVHEALDREPMMSARGDVGFRCAKSGDPRGHRP